MHPSDFEPLFTHFKARYILSNQERPMGSTIAGENLLTVFRGLKGMLWSMWRRRLPVWESKHVSTWSWVVGMFMIILPA